MERPPFSSYDSFEPASAWTIALPRGADAHGFCRALLAAGEDTGAFVVGPVEIDGVRTASGTEWLASRTAGDEPLPFSSAFHGSGGRISVTTRVAFRAADGAVVSEPSSDAGALLARLAPHADLQWRRRFAAPRPFIAPWSETKDGVCTVTLAFWTSAFSDDNDAPVHAENRARLLALRERLVRLSAEAGAALDAPMA